MTDIEIANTVKLKPIIEIASKLGIDPDTIEQYGKYKAKLPLSLIDPAKMHPCRRRQNNGVDRPYGRTEPHWQKSHGRAP